MGTVTTVGRGLLAALPLFAAGCLAGPSVRPAPPTAGCPEGPFATGQPACRLLPRLHKGETVSGVAVSVTGLVRNPGYVGVPPCGLQLNDAVALAGGDQPAQLFNGLNPAGVLVTLERRGGTYHFSLPLVTHDSAGRIRLVDGDRVKVESAGDTPLGRSMFPRSANTPNGDRAAWRSILRRDDVGSVPLEFEVPFLDQGAPQQNVTVAVTGSAAPTADRGVGTIITNAVAPEVVTVGANFPTELTSRQRAAGQAAGQASGNATLLDFAGASAADPESTVLVVHRKVPGESHLFVLLRPGSRTGPADRSVIQDVLGRITVIPGDSVATGALVQLPVVLQSLATPELFSPGRRRPADEPCHGTALQAISRVGKPVADLLKAPLQRIVPPSS